MRFQSRFYSSLLPLAIAFLCMSPGVFPVSAAPLTTPEAGRGENVLIVGTRESPPFAFRSPEGEWRGISIDLWRSIAAKLEYAYEFREADIPGLISGVTESRFDAAVAALTLTAEREAAFDFSHPFYYTGLSIAVPRHDGGGWYGVARQFISFEFLQVVIVLVFLLLIIGFLVWFFERRKNAEQFPGNPVEGILASFWWSAVTMTTVGYGDKAPKTPGGRLVALVWMFAALILISSFTAAITSSLTVGRLTGPLQSSRDLPSAQIGTVSGSTSEAYLNARRLSFTDFENLEAALRALAEGRLDGVVYDEAILRYWARKSFPNQLRVLPETLDNQYYGIALPPGSARRDPVNHELLKILHSQEWDEILYRYLGN